MDAKHVSLWSQHRPLSEVVHSTSAALGMFLPRIRVSWALLAAILPLARMPLLVAPFRLLSVPFSGRYIRGCCFAHHQPFGQVSSS
jgi:hypothetical protein